VARWVVWSLWLWLVAVMAIMVTTVVARTFLHNHFSVSVDSVAATIIVAEYFLVTSGVVAAWVDFVRRAVTSVRLSLCCASR